MNTKKIEIASEILTEQMNHWLLFPLVLTAMGVLRSMTGMGHPAVLLWAVCSLVPLLFFVFRCKIRYLIPLVLAHAAVAVLAFLVPGLPIADRVVCAVCAVGYVLYSLILRLKQDSLYSGGFGMPFGVGLSAAAILLQHYQGVREWEKYYYFSLIAAFLLYFVIYYMDHYLEFLSMNKSSTGFLPAVEMFRSGMGLVLAYTLLGAGLLVFSIQFEWLAGILRPLKELLLRFLRFLFSRTPAPEAEEIPMMEEQPRQSMGDLGLPEPAEEPFWLWDVLEAVVIVVLGCAIVVGLAVLLWKLLKLIRKYLVLRRSEQSLDIGDAVDFREKCELEKSAGKKGFSFFGALSPRERVRKLYKKKLLASAGQEQSRLELYTAREWEARLETEGMASLYEQARYSDHEVTGADVKRMKEICRR